MLFELSLQPDKAARSFGRIDVEVDWEGRSWIYVVFRASGFGEGIVLPETGDGRRDELWRHTCCEVFGQRRDGSYVEFNLSPSTAWAAYEFSGYRADMTNLDVVEPRITFEKAEGGFVLTAFLFSSDWPHMDAIGLSAVIETGDGTKSCWALNHPSDKPDFHHPESFALKSPVLGTS
mgnify:CR=1 FL=1|tara:strand:+ start:84 stop:614 length:531 start_codon:yes stop_codon:yes gene_type:complete